MINKPVVAGREPIVKDLEPGVEYWWCRCGRSKEQPFCDGSHKGTGIEPMRFQPTGPMKARFCACKLTKHPPFCDGSHLNLPKS